MPDWYTKRLDEYIAALRALPPGESRGPVFPAPDLTDDASDLARDEKFEQAERAHHRFMGYE